MPAIFLKKALRDFRTHKLRSIPLVAIIIIGGIFAMTFVSIGSLMLNMEKYVWEGQKYHHVKLVVRPQDSDALESKVLESIAETDIKVDYMFRARYDLSIQKIEAGNDKKLEAQLYILDPDREFNVDTLYYYDGTDLTSITTNKSGVGVIDYEYASTEGWENGNYFALTGLNINMNIQCVGRVGSPEYIVKPGALSDAFAIDAIPTIWMQTNNTNTGTPFQANEIVFYFANEADKTPFMEDLLSRINNADILQIEGRNAIMLQMMTMIQGITTGFSLIIGLITCVMIYLMLKRQIEEENQTLGMFKAMGMQNRELITGAVYYALFVSILGGVIGTAIGVYTGMQLTEKFIKAYMIFFPSVPGISLTGGLWIYTFLITVIGLSVFGALMATRKIFKISPMKAIRPDILDMTPEKPSKLDSWATKLKRRLSPLQKFSLRTIMQQRQKTAVIVAGLIMATVITMFGISMISSYRKSMDVMFTELDRWDMVVYLNGNVPEDNITQLLENYGIADQIDTAEPFFMVPIRFDSDLTTLYFVTGYYANSTLRKFAGGATLSSGTALFTKDLYLQLGLESNQNIDVLNFNSEKVGFEVGEPLEEFIGNGIYMTIEDARMLANLTKAKSINGLMLKTAYSDDVAEKISNNNDGLVRKVFIKGEYRESMESALGQKQVFLDTFFMGGLLIGIAITVMVVSTMISERKREFINFRAIGVTNPEIYKVILSELLVIGAIGLGLGLLVSIPAMNGLANFMTTFGFIISSAYTIMDLVVTSILIMISVVIAAWLSLRDLFKTRISEFLVSRVIG